MSKMESLWMKVSLEFSVAKISSMLIILLVIIPNVSSRPTGSPAKADNIKLRKRPTVADVRHSIRELEQIERYYQQLLIRGYLPESDARRLELLNEFIEQLRTRLQSLVNAEPHN